MEKLTVTCPKCLASYAVDATHVGKSARCNKCESTFVIAKPTESLTLVYPPASETSSQHDRKAASAQGDSVDMWNVHDVILGVYEVKPIRGDSDDGKYYAEGGMGLVYRVHHFGWDLDLAVKSPKRETFATERGKDNFERECETWIDLGLHPNIVSCYYVRHLDGIPLVFAEFVEGGTLQDWVHDRRLYRGGPDESLRRILDIAIQFAWGLDYAHDRGLVHQDVKPGNVMMRDGVPKVTDFGLAKAQVALGDTATEDEYESARERTREREQPDHGDLKSTLVTWGGMTPGYCSPEQVEAAAQAESGVPTGQRTKLTRRTDIWSWGVSILEMFCGKPPCRYGGQTAGKVLRAYLKKPPEDEGLPAMPDALAMLLKRCFRKKVSERPKNMAEVADQLFAVYRQVTGRKYPRQPPVTAELKADGLNNRAASLLDLGKQAEAGQLLDEAWQQYPWQPELTHNRALLAWRAGRSTDTDLVSHLEKLCITRPQDWEAPYSLGLVQLERGEVQPAIEALQKSVALGGVDEVRNTLERAHTLLPRAPRCVRSFAGRAESVTTVYLGGDERWALSGIDDRTLRVWDITTGGSVLAFDAPSSEPGASSLSTDGRWELVAEEGDTFHLREAASGRRTSAFRKLVWGPPSGVPTADGQGVLSAGDDHALELCESGTGNLVRTFTGHTGTVHSISLSADGRWALSGGGDKTLRLWEVATGRCVRTFKGHSGAVNSVFLAPNARWALSASTGETLRVWDLELLCDAEPRFVAPVLLCHVTSSEEASRAQARFADLYSTAHQLAEGGHYEQALRVARAARGLTGYDVASESLELWNSVGSRCLKTDLRDAWCVQTFQGHDADVRSGVLTADAGQVLSASSDRSLRLWDATTGNAKQLFQGHTDSVRSVSVSGDGRLALSGGWDKTLRLWDVESGRCSRVFEGHSNYVNSVVLSADGRWALSGSWDRSLRLWHATTGKCVRSFTDHTDYVNSVFLSSDTRWVLSGSEDKTVRLWDAATGHCLRTFEGHTDWVYAAALSADARRALSASKDWTLRVWDVASETCLHVLKGHTNLVTSVSISADGRWALSGSKDNTMRLWDLLTGRCCHVFQAHTGLVSSVSLSADGRWALSGSEDGLLHLWELDWEYEFPGWVSWDERARHCLETFLILHSPYVDGDVARRGRPQWNTRQFKQLLLELRHRGFGWLDPEGVRTQLEQMTADWEGPTPLPGE